MSRQAYPQYKPSDVAWLGDIPKHWKVLAIKFALAIPITDGPHETPEFLPDGIPFLSAESVKDDRLDFNRKRGFISPGDHARFSKKYVPKRGDVYMVKSGATTGNVARMETDEVFNIWSPLAVLRPHPAHSTTDFIFYFMKSRSFLASVEVAWSYGTQQNIGMGVVSNLRIALPLIEEQKAITAFLNKETARIDALIEKKQRQIELLQEKRSALISYAVTKGLDPNAKMKESGIEWLGKIPAHWDVRSIRRIAKAVKTGGTPPGAEEIHFDEHGFNWFTPSDFHDDVVLAESSRKLSEIGKKEVRVFPPMTVMMIGIGATIGKVALSSEPSSCNQQINAIVCNSKMAPKYLTYSLRIMREYIFRCGKFTTLPIINQEDTKALIVTCPPLNEQNEITSVLDKETERTDALICRIQMSIDKLREYRTALISAAVTGKVDVRKEVS